MATTYLSPPSDLPVHFFTIVLNGEPFIRHHIEAFRRLPFRWHWHVIEGVAALVKDTGWSVASGGRVPDDLHTGGRSVDGTTNYLDQLQRDLPDRITVYRKLTGQFWDGKLEMIQSFLPSVREDALIWQVDADELWRPDQIERMRAMFLAAPTRSAAYFLCHYFVGEALVTTSLDTYGNNRGYEWLRVWRFRPGDVWHSHEPPRLGRPTAGGGLINVGALDPFTHEETAAAGLVFDHYAYTLQEQARFKESYYGYKDAVAHWRRLQEHREFPARLSAFLPWVTDLAVVDRAAVAGVVPLARRAGDGTWTFRTSLAGPSESPLARRQLVGGRPLRRKTLPADAAPPALAWFERSRVRHLAVLALGGPVDMVLAGGFLGAVRRLFPQARITLFTTPAAAEWLPFCPHVNQIVSLPPAEAADAMADEVSRRWTGGFDLVLNPLPEMAEPLAGRLAGILSAGLRVGWQGAGAGDSGYTHLLEPLAGEHPVARHGRFLAAFAANRPDHRLDPEIWPSPTADLAALTLLREALEAGADRFVTLDLAGDPAGGSLSADRYAAIGRRLRAALGLTPVLLGGPAETALAAATAALGGVCVNTGSEVSMDTRLGLLRRVDLHVGPAAVSAHLAAAAGVPTVVIADGAAVPPWGAPTAMVPPAEVHEATIILVARHVLGAARRR